MLERFPLPAGTYYRFRDTWHADRDGGARHHEGTDIGAREGTPVLAATPGRVVSVSDDGTSRCGFGVFIRVQNGANSELHGYCHFKAIPVVREGERVAAGDVLGYVGASGNATDSRGREHPHLHFQIEELPSRVRRNPFPDLAAAERAMLASPEAQAVRASLIQRRRRRAVERDEGAGWGAILALAALAYWLAS
jgi:peptidoglycan LD-endopeptidase LytH